MIGTAGKEAPEGWTLLHTAESIDRQPHRQGDQNIYTQADTSQERTQQQETLAQTLAFGRGDPSCRPVGSQQELEEQKDQGHSHEEPVGENFGTDQCAQPAQRIENHTLYHATPVANFVKHTGRIRLMTAAITAAAATAARL